MNESKEMLEVKDFISDIKALITSGDIVFNKDNSIKELSDKANFYLNEFIDNSIYEPILEIQEKEKNNFLAAVKKLNLIDDKYKLSDKLYLCQLNNSKIGHYKLAALLGENKCIPVSDTFYEDILYYVNDTKYSFFKNYFNNLKKDANNQFYNVYKNKNDDFSFVYIGKQLNENKLYKIGMTKDLSSRLSTFKCGNCFIEFVMTKPSNNAAFLEKKLHNIFKSKSFNREWYKLDSDDLNLLAEMGFNYVLK